MAKLNAKQKLVFLQEVQNLSAACKINMDSPDNDDRAHKNICGVIRLTRLLLEEISIHEFLVATKEQVMREYYQDLIELHASPKAYKKKGYGPQHGKVGPKKKS